MIDVVHGWITTLDGVVWGAPLLILLFGTHIFLTIRTGVMQRYLSDDDPNHVFVLLEFSSREDAEEGRRRLLASGVLDRFADKHGPNVVQEVDG